MVRKIGSGLLFAVLALNFSFSSLSQATDLLTSAEHVFYRSTNTRVGIEVEFSGMDIKKAADIVLHNIGGTLLIKNVVYPTTLKHILPDGTRVYNEATVPEYIIKNSSIGGVVIKPDFNQADDQSINLKSYVIELVTEPLFENHIPLLQKAMDELKRHGAVGTTGDNAVATQMNTEIAEGDIRKLNWQVIVDTLRSYSRLTHRAQISQKLNVPKIRQKFLQPLSPGMMKKLLDPSYRPSGREFFDDIIYRQSLELLGDEAAWTMDIEEAHKRLLAESNPVVPRVVKLVRVRLSSLLMWAFPEDPMSKIYFESGWAVGRPLIEWREWNTDFNITSAYRQALGLLEAAKNYGYYDHDKLISELSGVEAVTVRELRKKEERTTRNNPVIFRYFLGNPKTVDKKEYADMKESYADTTVGFLPLYEVGKVPLQVPGESVVFHRIPMHRHSVLGKYNPALINTNIIQALENKYVEYKFWNSYAPGTLPRTVLLRDLVKTGASPELIQKVLDKNFSSGWVLKGVWDLGSEKTIVTDKSMLARTLNDYRTSNFDQFKREIEKKYAKEDNAPEYILAELKTHKGYLGWKIAKLIADPDLAIVQERVEIDREFRVEVILGKVLGGKSTQDRFAYEYMHEIDGKKRGDYVPPAKWKIAAVEKFAQKIVSQLPSEFRNMNFGTDIAVLKNGNVVMIESNPGANSNFLYEEEDPSVKLLRKALDKVPQDVKSGKINLGLSPKGQMDYLKAKFAEWKVEPAKQYPGIIFSSDEMIDPEFHPKNIDTKIFQISKLKNLKLCSGLF